MVLIFHMDARGRDGYAESMKTSSLVAILLLFCATASAQFITAHRGASHDAPENTLAAFRLAWEKGADAIEGDFRLTKDGRVVCVHDADTERVAGKKLVVAQSTLAQLKVLDVGSWKSRKYRDERIPTLAEVLAVVPEGKRIFIELKNGAEIVAPIKRVIDQTKIDLNQVVIISFNKAAIVEAKKSMPGVKAHWLSDYNRPKDRVKSPHPKWGVLKPNPAEVVQFVTDSGADGFGSRGNRDVVNTAFVNALREGGIKELHVWTVNDPVDAAYYRDLGFDAITTDRPEYLRKKMPTRRVYDNLQVHLELDGDLEDSSPYKRHGQFTSKKSDKPRFGKAVFKEGLDLKDNKHAAIEVPYKLPTAGSIALWYHARQWYNYQTVFDCTEREDDWEMWIYKDGKLRFRDGRKGSYVDHQFHESGDVNEWHHIAVTWDRRDRTNRAMRLYVNGYLVGHEAWNADPWIETGERFGLGGAAKGNEKANGMFDDVAIFDLVLTGDEVRRVMNRGVKSLK